MTMKKTITSKQIKNTITSAYAIKVLKFSPTKSGIINHSFFIDTQNGKYVLRIYSHKTYKDILFEIKAMNMVKKNGLPVPKIFKNTSGKYKD